MTSDAPLRCKCRKQAPTSLRCARCFVPICPDCSRIAPAGMLCKACATGQKSHLYQVSAGGVARGAILSLAAATFGSFGFFMLWMGFLYGLGVSEVLLRAGGRKRGPAMEVTAVVSCLGGLVLGWIIHATTQGVPSLGEYLLMYLKDPWTYVGVACAVVGSVTRIRSL
jgi:hypothetical protein